MRVPKHDLKVRQVPVGKLKPWDRNPRRNDEAAERLTKLIESHGFVNPIIATPDGVVRAGHTRLKAAISLGLKTVPVLYVDLGSEEMAQAFSIADNKSSEWAEWDSTALAGIIEDLRAGDVDIALTGFSPEDLADLFDPGVLDGLKDPDEIPEPPDTPITRPGDLWILGDHRLLCGDSSLPVDVDRLLEGAPIHLVNTDPPYNVKVEPRSNNAIAAGLSSFKGPKHHQKLDVERFPGKSKATHRKLRAKDRPLENDFLSDEEFARMLRAWFGNISRVLVPGRGFYIWGGYANCANYPSALKENGLYFSQSIIWVKEHPVLTRKDFMGNHEWNFYGWKEGAAHVFLGPNNVPDVWIVKKVAPQRMIHLTEKPVELAVRAIRYSSRAGENVLDLFGGSGSTLIGCQQTGRKAFLMEKDALYCDVICGRWSTFAGKDPVRVDAAGKRTPWSDLRGSELRGSELPPTARRGDV